MANQSRWGSHIRKASEGDISSIRRHFLALDETSLRSRFGGAVNEGFVQRYVDSLLSLQTTIFLCETDDAVRGIGELRRLSPDNLSAEAAFTVDASSRDLGMGAALMAALLDEAARTEMREVFSCFDIRNRPMARICEKFQGQVGYEGCDCIARIDVEAASRWAFLRHARPYRAARAVAKALGGAARVSASAAH